MPKGTPRSPPVPKGRPFVRTMHGVTWDDPLYWLKESDNPEVITHLKEENAYTNLFLEKSGNLSDCLYQELLGRLEQNNESASFPDGDYIYQSRIKKGENHRRYYRKKRTDNADWTLYFDAETESAENDYFDLAFLDISPDGQTLAYAIDLIGDESYTLRFRDLATGNELPDLIDNVAGEGEWDASSKVYYFVREDESKRPWQIFRHRLGSRPNEAQLVYSESDPLYHVGIYKSQDSHYIFASSESKETTEIGYLLATDPEALFTILFPRRDGIQYWLEHLDGNWLVRTNEDAPDHKLLSVSLTETDLSTGTPIIDAQVGRRLNDVLPLKNHLIAFERSNGLDQIRILELDTLEEHMLEVPDSVYDLQPTVNAEFNTTSFNFIYSSPIRPSQTVRYDLVTREREVLRASTVPSGHDPDQYTVYRIHAESSDGTAVPMTIIHKKCLSQEPKTTSPALLYGYGAYGSPVETDFRSSWLTWLERGFTIGIAHVRGGGLLGEEWYQSGKLSHKENSFNDFIACAEELIRKNYTTPDQLLVEGGSAGGLLVGTVLNRRPDLFKAALLEVPFVDVLNTMLDPSLPLTTFEYEEWGNPAEEAAFKDILKYSPYENVRPAAYPSILATAGLSDPRVPYWEAAKWIARIRKHNTGKGPIILKTLLDSGHSGVSGRYDSLKEIALQQAFLLSELPV